MRDRGIFAPCLALLLLMSAIDALNVGISTGDLLTKTTSGRAVILFAPENEDPLAGVDVTGSNYNFGKNVYGVKSNSTIYLSGGSNRSVANGVYGFPNVSFGQLPAGNYNVQAFLTPYESVRRSDGSRVMVHFPCGDGSPPVGGVGSLQTEATPVTISDDDQQTINLTFSPIVQPEEATVDEVGGCSQSNYADTELLKHIKIRSKHLSHFWNRDMYVGANVLLPAGYNEKDTSTRYPVIYNQTHWPGSEGAFQYPSNTDFKAAWDTGSVNASRSIPKFILVTFRHETPFFDDSYAVNSANLGPYGDALNGELVAHINTQFNTIAKPYARIQDGGSTGGWESLASLIFRPDLYCACFTYYPDPIDFRRLQNINLYKDTNAFINATDGSLLPSACQFSIDNVSEIIFATSDWSHWELSLGTSSRSQSQLDVWNVVYSAQGSNGYPLQVFNKIYGDIDDKSVEYWKEYDLSLYLQRHWRGTKNLGKVLQDRIHISVGTHDDYYLDKSVAMFKQRVVNLGGASWAQISFTENGNHGNLYRKLSTFDYLGLIHTWVKDHSPGASKALTSDQTSKKSRGNHFQDVMAKGGHQAAMARQDKLRL